MEFGEHLRMGEDTVDLERGIPKISTRKFLANRNYGVHDPEDNIYVGQGIKLGRVVGDVCTLQYKRGVYAQGEAVANLRDELFENGMLFTEDGKEEFLESLLELSQRVVKPRNQT
jgi:hypothetical protein